MKGFPSCLLAMVLPIGLSPLVIAESKEPLSLEQAVAIAQQHDPWLSGSRYRQQATEAQSVAAGELPDPMVSLGFANLPVDSFDFGQEPMTQFKIGLSQAFPRGDTRSLKRQQLHELGRQHPYMREDRRAQVEVTVSQLWLELYRNQESIRLIERDRALFEHLVDIAQSSYANALGNTRQQDLISAQLELTRLEDRLTVLQEQQAVAYAQLSEWLPDSIEQGFMLSNKLPVVAHPRTLGADSFSTSPEHLKQILLNHPRIKRLDQQILATATGVKLARQKFKPQWGVNADYGYRDDDPMGHERSDFFSVGVTFDVPLFTSNRQDKDVQAAVATGEASKTEKALALRSMHARFETAQARLQRLNQRKTLYEERLLQETHDQTEASLNAYMNDIGDFAEALHARIAELNAGIDFLNIEVDRLKTIAELNYFLFSTSAGSAEGVAP